ncbi:MAG: hypothetical protein KKA81_12820 [Bacteroidetes bacterium]|nr:hypothetical protein [Bacteroidota bacterium]
MKKIMSFLGIILLMSVILSSCLTVEKKEYTFEFTGANSGKLTIKYFNIMSSMEDGQDMSETDFAEMIKTYYVGEQLEQDYPMATNIEKRLFEEDGVLCAEVVVEFSSLEGARLYRHKDMGPYMFCIKSTFDGEEYLASNGEYGGEVMPVVFWPEKESVLRLVTSIMQPDESTVSLLPQFQKWQEGN